MKTTLLKSLTLVILLCSSQVIIAADKLPPGSEVKMLNLIPGKIYKFDVPGFADDGVYTVSFPGFNSNSLKLNLPPTLSASGVGARIIVGEYGATNPGCSSLDGAGSTSKTIDGHAACIGFLSNFNVDSSVDYSSAVTSGGSISSKSDVLTHQFSLSMYVNIQIDESTLVRLSFGLDLENKKTIPANTYDLSNQLPIYLANKGVVPEKAVREFAKQELLKLVDTVGITKVK